MKFDIIKFIKGLVVRSDSLTPSELELTTEGTDSTKTTLKSVQTENRILNLPDASGTLVELDATQVLTNKTINADDNTISDLTLNSFKEETINLDISESSSDNDIPTSKAVKDYVDSSIVPLIAENVSFDDEDTTSKGSNVQSFNENLDARLTSEILRSTSADNYIEEALQNHIDSDEAHLASSIVFGTTNVAAELNNLQDQIDNFNPLPPGGIKGQVLTKKSNVDGDVDWEDPTGGNEFYTQEILNNQTIPVEITGMRLDPTKEISAKFEYDIIRSSPSMEDYTWTGRTAYHDNWTSVAYGNGLFVAVALDSKIDNIMTSPDGLIWTKRSFPEAIMWAKIKFFDTEYGGLFIAVGLEEKIAFSFDGINWTLVTPLSGELWTSVAYGNGLFVLINNNHIITSPDLGTWSLVPETYSDMKDITYGGDKFVIVNNSTTLPYRILTSSDGITWVSRTSSLFSLFRVVYGNGLFIAYGSRTITSTDGINWSAPISIGSNNPGGGITYGDGLFVICEFSGATGAHIFTSQNGINWTTRISPSSFMTSVTYGDGLFLVVSNDGPFQAAYMIAPILGETLIESGSFRVQYKPRLNTYRIVSEEYGGDLSEITLSIDNSGQIFYVSSNMENQDVGEIEWCKSVSFEKERTP